MFVPLDFGIYVTYTLDFQVSWTLGCLKFIKMTLNNNYVGHVGLQIELKVLSLL